MSKISISYRAFIARMQRKLKKDGLKIISHRTPLSGWAYYSTVNIDTNTIDLELVSLDMLIAWAREDGTLKAYESVEYLEL